MSPAMERMAADRGAPLHLNLKLHPYGAYVDGVLYGRFSNIETAARTALYHGQYGGESVVRDEKGNAWEKPDLRAFVVNAEKARQKEVAEMVMAGMRYA